MNRPKLSPATLLKISDDQTTEMYVPVTTSRPDLNDVSQIDNVGLGDMLVYLEAREKKSNSRFEIQGENNA